MKKTFFFLSLFVLLSGCGGGGENTAILANLRVNIQGISGGGGGQGQAGRALNISGGGLSITCSQSPSLQNPDDPQCQQPAAGSGTNQDAPITFINLPAGVSYSITEVSLNGTAVASGSCPVTIVDSITATFPAGNPCVLGDVTENQLSLTFTIV